MQLPAEFLQNPGAGQYQFNPSAQTTLADGDILIVIGTPEQLAALQQINAGV